MSKLSDRTARRPRWRHVLLLALLALVPIVLAPAGSATRPPVTKFEICVQNTASSPSCTGTAASSFTGNTPSTIQLSVTNDSTSTTSIGSADIVVPDQLKVVDSSAAPSKYVSTAGQHIKFQGINLPAGKSFVATFTADVACGGTFAWSTSQSAYGSSDLTAPAFSNPGYVATASATTSIVTACHLGFVNQPTDTVTTSTIRDAGASQGDPVTVGLFNEAGVRMSGCPVGYEAGCTVSVDKTGNGGTLSGDQTKDLLGSPLVATFDDLSIATSDLADQFNLTATGVGGFAPTASSASFLVGESVTALPCPGNSCSSPGHATLSGTGLTTSFADVSSTSGFTFMTLSPYKLDIAQLPLGCANEKGLTVAGFAESDGRLPGSGTLTIKYYVNNDAIKARYGKNVGAQFIPICVGGRPVDPTSGVAHDCNDPSFQSVGWIGDGLDATGRFTGKQATAICDPDGYYWGIIGSFQDKLSAGNPVVTKWGGASVNSINYSEFDMTVPPNWDWRAGPG